MKKSALVVVIVAIVAAVGWLVYHNRTEPLKPEGGNDTTTTTDEPVKPDEPAKKPRPQSAFYVKPKAVPPGWEDFYELSQMQKLNRVTKVMNKKEQLDPEVYAFFKAELFNRNHWDVTRNNMANALAGNRDENNRHTDPDLHEALITMLDDETEDPVWRDYSLQFLSEFMPDSSDPKRVQEVITRHSKGDDSIAGTAMIHMALQEQYGNMTPDDEFNERLAKQLENPEVHRDTKVSIIGVMGKRKDVKRLPLIRKYAKQDDNATLKRVAIAALGTIGASPETAAAITDDDRALIEAALKHKNGGVQRAAKGALSRLDPDRH